MVMLVRCCATSRLSAVDRTDRSILYDRLSRRGDMTRSTRPFQAKTPTRRQALPDPNRSFAVYTTGDVPPKFVRNTTHLVAANEYRSSFDLVSALPSPGASVPNIEEILLPGAHSDIGGGYPR